MEYTDRTAHHRCCSHRDSDRKPDLSRLTDCVFGPLLPLEKLFSRPRQCHFPEGGTPMGSKIYVGGLPYAATESQLTTLFATHGTVESARVITDKFTGQSRGFGFVEMGSRDEAQAAIRRTAPGFNLGNGAEQTGRHARISAREAQWRNKPGTGPARHLRPPETGRPRCRSIDAGCFRRFHQA